MHPETHASLASTSTSPLEHESSTQEDQRSTVEIVSIKIYLLKFFELSPKLCKSVAQCAKFVKCALLKVVSLGSDTLSLISSVW
jgi:hypothetical protein